MSLEGAARCAVAAFETDDIDKWLLHLRIQPNCGDTELGKLLLKLRQAWWHNGTYRQREKVCILVAKINHRMKWDAERATPSEGVAKDV